MELSLLYEFFTNVSFELSGVSSLYVGEDVIIVT